MMDQKIMITVILSEAKRSRSCNAADAVGEARLSIPVRYLKGFMAGSLDFARDDN
jgi:hypothetical protein